MPRPNFTNDTQFQLFQARCILQVRLEQFRLSPSLTLKSEIAYLRDTVALLEERLSRTFSPFSHA